MLAYDQSCMSFGCWRSCGEIFWRVWSRPLFPWRRQGCFYVHQRLQRRLTSGYRDAGSKALRLDIFSFQKVNVTSEISHSSEIFPSWCETACCLSPILFRVLYVIGWFIWPVSGPWRPRAKTITEGSDWVAFLCGVRSKSSETFIITRDLLHSKLFDPAPGSEDTLVSRCQADVMRICTSLTAELRFCDPTGIGAKTITTDRLWVSYRRLVCVADGVGLIGVSILAIVAGGMSPPLKPQPYEMFQCGRE